MGDQLQRDWPYLVWTTFPALYLVGSLAFGRFSRWKNFQSMLQDSRSRLFLILFVVITGLSHHDVLIKPIQPIHFARGYDWIALFFLASPAILKILDRVTAIRVVPMRIIAVSVVLLFMLSDNLFWFASFRDPSVQNYSIILTPDQSDALQWLNRTAHIQH